MKGEWWGTNRLPEATDHWVVFVCAHIVSGEELVKRPRLISRLSSWSVPLKGTKRFVAGHFSQQCLCGAGETALLFLWVGPAAGHVGKMMNVKYSREFRGFNTFLWKHSPKLVLWNHSNVQFHDQICSCALDACGLYCLCVINTIWLKETAYLSNVSGFNYGFLLRSTPKTWVYTSYADKSTEGIRHNTNKT